MGTAERGGMCSKCHREAQGPKPVAGPPSWAPAPQSQGTIHITTLNQMGPEATALGRAEGLPTMLCGFFATGVAKLLAQRYPVGDGPLRLTAAQLVALARELREPAILLPAVTESMRSIRAARIAYTERFPGAFVAPNVDEALGEIIAPSDERTVTGYLSAEAGPWELSHWLRSAPGGSEVAARVGILRHHLAREHATDPRVVHRIETEFRRESTLYSAETGIEPGARAEWFLEVHPESAAAAGAPIRVDFPAVDGMRLAGVGLPLSVPAPALPPILVVDASVLDGHYNLMVMVEVVEATEPLEGGDLPSGLASPVLPGRYCLFVDSLWPKCKAVWKYGDAAELARAAIHGGDPAGASTSGGAGDAAAPAPGTSEAVAGLVACPQCQGPLWRLEGLEGGGGVHLHITGARYPGSTIPGF